MKLRQWGGLAVAGVLLVSACGGGSEGDTATATTVAETVVDATTTTTTTLPAPPPPNASFADVSFGTELVADLELATAVAWRRDDPTMFVTTQDGVVYAVGDDVSVVLDISAEVSEYAPGSERGLLGIAFDPRDDRMFLDYTDLDQDTHVVSFELANGVAVPESRREYLFLDQPGLGHNGGRLLFDAAGHLYIASGDGGGSQGRDAQDTSKLFGVILRIIPQLDAAGYDIPADNPFADGVADQPEVWARGFRNPWTISIDDATGDMWIGDVGNDTYEEVNVMRGGQSGLNFGWDFFEGNKQIIYFEAPDDLVQPFHVYDRTEGIAVMGGHVYRGAAIPELQGAYLFGDLTGPVWASGADGVTELAIDPVKVLVGWAEDPSGEVYLLSHEDGVQKLVPG